jgi:uncharacterized protein (TIGR03435 family)
MIASSRPVPSPGTTPVTCWSSRTPCRPRRRQDRLPRWREPVRWSAAFAPCSTWAGPGACPPAARVYWAPAPLLAIQDAPAATFDVVSVKPNNSVGQGGEISRRNGGLYIVNQSLRTLIQFAYQLQPSQLVDAPDWVDRERFDVDARSSVKTPLTRLGETSQESLMFRAVLAERFGLRVRREARPLEIFALVVARGDGRLGSNLRRPANDFCERRFQAIKAGTPLPDDGQVCGIRGSNDQLTAGAFPLDAFATFLSSRVRRIVIDRTSLAGV